MSRDKLWRYDGCHTEPVIKILLHSIYDSMFPAQMQTTLYLRGKNIISIQSHVKTNNSSDIQFISQLIIKFILKIFKKAIEV